MIAFGALIRDDLRVADRDRFRSRIDRLRGKLLREILAAAGGAGIESPSSRKSSLDVGRLLLLLRRGVRVPGRYPRRPCSLVPGSVNACTSTGNTSAAEIYRNGRVTGLPNSTFASNSAINLRTNGMLIGRVMTWIRFVRTSAEILILPTTIESSESAVSALRSPSDLDLRRHVRRC